MAKRKYTYGKGSSEWEKPGDYYVDGKWICYYTDTGSGQSGKFTVKKALRLSVEFNASLSPLLLLGVWLDPES